MYKIYGALESSFKLNSDTWLFLIQEEDHPILLQQVEKLLNDGGSLDLEFRIIRSDSSIRHIRL